MAVSYSILVVDDNRSILTSLQFLLGDYFAHVLSLSSPQGMLALLEREEVDVVLLDMNFSAGINNGNEGLFWLQELKAHFPNLEISTSLPNNIEINSAKANKGLALKFLCGYLGIGLEECMAFGDGTNDLALLKTAGRGMAMANADPEVLKATAYHTACTNEEDGVAIEIETCLKEV